MASSGTQKQNHARGVDQLVRHVMTILNARLAHLDYPLVTLSAPHVQPVITSTETAARSVVSSVQNVIKDLLSAQPALILSVLAMESALALRKLTLAYTSVKLVVAPVRAVAMATSVRHVHLDSNLEMMDNAFSAPLMDTYKVTHVSRVAISVQNVAVDQTSALNALLKHLN